MAFTRVNPLGWALFEELTSAQMNQLDINVSNAVDGALGGTYNLGNNELRFVGGPVVIDSLQQPSNVLNWQWWDGDHGPGMLNASTPSPYLVHYDPVRKAYIAIRQVVGVLHVAWSNRLNHWEAARSAAISGTVTIPMDRPRAIANSPTTVVVVDNTEIIRGDTVNGFTAQTDLPSGGFNALVYAYTSGRFIGGGDTIQRYSTDDGLTWQTPTTTDIPSGGTAEMATDGTIVVAVGAGGEVVRTIDGGDNWTTHTLPSPASGTPGILYNRRTGSWIVIQRVSGELRAYRSTDGGQNWTQVWSFDPTPETIDFDVLISGFINGVAMFRTGDAWWASDDDGDNFYRVQSTAEEFFTIGSGTNYFGLVEGPNAPEFAIDWLDGDSTERNCLHTHLTGWFN